MKWQGNQEKKVVLHHMLQGHLPTWQQGLYLRYQGHLNQWQVFNYPCWLVKMSQQFFYQVWLFITISHKILTISYLAEMFSYPLKFVSIISKLVAFKPLFTLFKDKYLFNFQIKNSRNIVC